MIVKSSYSLAINSISNKVEERLKSTIDAFIQFKDNFPESKYLEDLEITYNKSQDKLTQLKNNNDEI